MGETRDIHVWDMTHSCVERGLWDYMRHTKKRKKFSFMCGTRLIHMWDMADSRVGWGLWDRSILDTRKKNYKKMTPNHHWDRTHWRGGVYRLGLWHRIIVMRMIRLTLVIMMTVSEQHTATRCNTLQHAAAHCNTLQHGAWATQTWRIHVWDADCEIALYWTHETFREKK